MRLMTTLCGRFCFLLSPSPISLSPSPTHFTPSPRMPFEKVYGQLLRTFPSELRESSIQYRELKQIIGRLVDELNDLGLSPETLRQAISTIESGGNKPMGTSVTLASTRSEEQTFFHTMRTTEGKSVPQQVAFSKIIYEVISESGKSFPQLRVCMTTPTLSETPSNGMNSMECGTRKVINGGESSPIPAAVFAPPIETTMRDFVIPLVHDAKFFDLLEGNIQVLTAQMEKVHSEFSKSLLDLADMIADTCQPASVAGNYHPYSSVSTHPGTVEVKVRRLKSDLYAWREIFGLFVQSDVFQHSSDGRKVEWSIDESEKRLNAFADRVVRRKGDGALKEKFKHKQSAEALQMFIKLNFFILGIRKAFQANIEGIQKLVKKHTEHTALPIACSFSQNANVVSIGHLHQSSRNSLSGLIHPRLFMQEIEEKLFPIVPNQDDYSCAICTNIAFKPIRLSCTHLFCARCLVKMQRRGEGSCPMCRAPSVLEANTKNVDWALLNFMEDWFPREAGQKMRDNEKEVVKEQMAAWRRNQIVCIIT